MTLITEADRRIALKERELAKIQTEVTTPIQLESNLVRESLHATLNSAAVFAGAVVTLLDDLGLSLEEGLSRTGSEVTGRQKEKP